jgi:hypothetical protein
MNEEESADKNPFDEWECGLDVLQEKISGAIFYPFC